MRAETRPDVADTDPAGPAPMSRRRVLGLFGAAAAATLAGPALAFARAAGRRHVLHLPVDDLRCSLGCYGDPVAVTPNLDALAARGCLFERAYVQQAVCAASRASVLTGTRPATTGVSYPYNDAFINDVVKRHPTFPTWFERQGAASRMLGKIHHQDHADIEELDTPHDGVKIPGRASWRDYADPANNAADADGRSPEYEAADVPDDGYRDGVATDLAIDFLREYDRSDESDPMFLSLGYRKPHLPFNAPKRYWDLYDPAALPDYRTSPPEGATPWSRRSYELGGDQYANAVAADDGLVGDATARTLTHGYYACVSYIDALVGKLLAALAETRMADDTVIVLWGDHGFHLGEQQVWGKHVNYEVATRVPFLIAGPDVPVGRRVPGPVEMLDVYPTLCDLTGTPQPDGLEGGSLVPLIRGDSDGLGRVAFSEYHRRNALGYAARSLRWRYVEWRHPETGEILARELFDHNASGDELDDVADEHPAVVAELSAKLAEVHGF